MNTVSIQDVISWWENELTDDKRTELMGNYSWHGSTESRHKQLRKMHKKWLEDEKK